ncbi:hypothetical protein [Nocardia carnea]|uniref:hypothetical protein n=1 Tax=Nocardia carnea TaxID=37328 RepID=UPI0024580EE3|nr:hypothetical protein [Nocardia carnea]
MRHPGRPPNLLQVLVLVFAAVVLTLEVKDGRNSEAASVERVSVLQVSTVVGERVVPGGAESSDSAGPAAHCPHLCFRASAVRPRTGYVPLVILLFAGLLLGGAVFRRSSSRSLAAGPDVGVKGAELLLRLCVCRR